VLNLQAELEDLEDASNELMLLDDDQVSIESDGCWWNMNTSRIMVHIGVQVRFVVGESFYHAGPEETEEQLQEGEYTCYVWTNFTHRNKQLVASIICEVPSKHLPVEFCSDKWS